MYLVNPFPRKLIITSDEVIRMSATDTNPDPRVIQQAIQIAEDRFIKNVICKDLYYDFRNKKNVVVDSINIAFLQSLFTSGVTLNEGEIVNAIELVDNDSYVDLWNEHLWKLIAETVIYIATPTNWSKFSSSGQILKNPKGLPELSERGGDTSVSIKDLQFLMDKSLMDRIDPLRSSLEEYLFDNQASFPLYNCKNLSKPSDGVSMNRKTAWVHGIYDKKRNCDC